MGLYHPACLPSNAVVTFLWMLRPRQALRVLTKVRRTAHPKNTSSPKREHGRGPSCSRGGRGSGRWGGQEGETMKKRLGGLVLLAALGGCVESQPGSYMSNANMGAPASGGSGCMHGACMPREIPGVMG